MTSHAKRARDVPPRQEVRTATFVSLGQRTVRITIGEKEYRITFNVHEVRHVILSVAALVRNGSKVQFIKNEDDTPQVEIVTLRGDRLVATAKQNVFVIYGRRFGISGVRRLKDKCIMPVTDMTTEGDGAAQDKAEPEGDVEARPPRKVAVRAGPTKEEREQHAVTHLPYRVWCEYCVAAKGKDDPHLRQIGRAHV